jgi:hypothetical protein
MVSSDRRAAVVPGACAEGEGMNAKTLLNRPYHPELASQMAQLTHMLGPPDFMCCDYFAFVRIVGEEQALAMVGEWGGTPAWVECIKGEWFPIWGEK